MRRRRKKNQRDGEGSGLGHHLLEGVPISILCEELGMAPTVPYRWRKECYENGAAVFDKESKGRRERNRPRDTPARLSVR